MKFIAPTLIKVASILNYAIPKGNIITFWSFPDFCDNSYALFQHMATRDFRDYQLVWLLGDNTNRTREFLQDEYPNLDVRCVRKNSIRGMYYFLRSKYLFFTHGIYRNISRPQRQIAVHLSHGMPFKRIGFVDHRLPSEIPNCSYVVATSNLFRPIFSKSWGMDEASIIDTGSPRNDLLYSTRNVLKKLSIDGGQYKTKILWMPTFRVSVRGEIRRDGLPADSGLPLLGRRQLADLNEYLSKKNLLLLVKTHAMDQTSVHENPTFTHIRFVTNETLHTIHEDVHSLLSEVDALLTDYSSIFFDFLLTDKPIGFIHSDVENYQTDRGFLFTPVDEWTPGCKIYTFEQLIAFFENVDGGIDDYVEARKNLRDLVHLYTDGNSSERLLRFLKIVVDTQVKRTQP